MATFTGGFKRYHGAFKYGPLALKNHGTHYGFLENGVYSARFNPDLPRSMCSIDGWVDMKTWTEEDNSLLPRIRYARQNGVPIIDGFDQAARCLFRARSLPDGGEGNWSGSADEKLRTMRAGAALQESAESGFSSTPFSGVQRHRPWPVFFRLTSAATPCFWI